MIRSKSAKFKECFFFFFFFNEVLKSIKVGQFLLMTAQVRI